MDALFAAVRKAERWLLVALMILLAVFCFAQVFWRLILQNPLAWSEEVSRYLFVWLTFIGAAAAVATRGHFLVDVVIGKLPPRPALAFRLFGYLAILFFAYIMLFHGWELLKRILNQFSPAMRLPMVIPYAALPLSGLLMILHLVELARADLRESRNRNREGRA
ncbi:MAG: TRAP transporter small permease [Planctomycetota bacterium]|nr:TRAP transporter small permease [Planctomycetota bacterium]